MWTYSYHIFHMCFLYTLRKKKKIESMLPSVPTLLISATGAGPCDDGQKLQVFMTLHTLQQLYYSKVGHVAGKNTVCPDKILYSFILCAILVRIFLWAVFVNNNLNVHIINW